MAETTNMMNGATAPAAPEAAAPAVPEQAKALAADPKMDAFARKERQLRRMQQELQAEKQQMTKRAQEYETGYISKSRLKDDFWGVLNEAGIDQESFTQQLINQPNMNDPTTRALMSKLKQLEEKQSAAERANQDATERQYKQAVQQISNEVKQLVDSNDAYETIKTMAAQDAVVELIEQTFTSTGNLMDIDEAAKQVEEYLLGEARKYTQLKKLQKPISEQQSQAPSVSAQKQPGHQVQIKTLTNAVPTQPAKRMSDKERRERALAAFHGQLKG